MRGIEKGNKYIETGKALNTAQVFFLLDLAAGTNYARE